MRCLVTGAAGYIGDNLTKRLISEGYYVRGLLHINRPKSVFHNKKLEYVIGDITDVESLKLAVKDIDVVFHCAAITKDYGSRKLFYQVNFKGTKNIAEVSEEAGVQRFIFLSSIRVTREKPVGWYSKTKALAEKILMAMYEEDSFPVVIIRPGDVYGPGATIWVLRLLQAIKKGQIALINHGKGIFHHVYIDNLIDAVISAMKEPRAVGKTFIITDGDNDTTWDNYLNDLAKTIGKSPIKKSIPKTFAYLLSKMMPSVHSVLKINPLFTPMAVEIFTNHQRFSVEEAEEILGYKPVVNFEEGMEKVRKWLYDEGYVNHFDH